MWKIMKTKASITAIAYLVSFKLRQASHGILLQMIGTACF
jgi:hypothetical protein